MTEIDALYAVSLLGGDQLDPTLSAEALAARTAAVDTLRELRAVPLRLVEAIEPGHVQARLRQHAVGPEAP